jgi:hypothetical protein
MYRQALFCWEELLMFAPTHTNYLIRWAVRQGRLESVCVSVCVCGGGGGGPGSGK